MAATHSSSFFEMWLFNLKSSNSWKFNSFSNFKKLLPTISRSIIFFSIHVKKLESTWKNIFVQDYIVVFHFYTFSFIYTAY